MKFALALLLSTFPIAAHACRAQQSPAPQFPAVRVSVDRVNVGVIVTNSRGNFVEGLTRSDFHVFDNGIEQPITDFAAIDEPAQVLLLIEAGPAVYLLEASHLQAAYGLLQGLALSDQVALVKYADAPEPILDFTSDKQLAASALGALHYNLGFGSLNLSASLAQTLAWLRNTQGKKSIVLLSTGIDTSPCNESLVILAQLRTGDVRLFAVSLAGGLRSIPPKDKKKPPATSQTSAQTDQQFAEADRFLHELAEATGGRAWFPVNLKDFRSVYAQLAQLIRHEYSVAFVPQTHDGAVHIIKVTVDPPAFSANAPPSYRIDHRRAYLAPAAAAN
ncbi:MAG TPA: VWA domain-containing protein [Candidatus Dormibacteraeota bacterium]|nr:VWA domain-containing protein [Candidatus Dormibacteraeota bacterium]